MSSQQFSFSGSWQRFTTLRLNRHFSDLCIVYILLSWHPCSSLYPSLPWRPSHVR